MQTTSSRDTAASLSSPHAALVNGTQVQGFELDDVHRQGVLHVGAVVLPAAAFTKEQISPTRDTRLRWMQSVLRCTHYVAGAGEHAYLHQDEAPEISFVRRDQIDRSDEAYTD